LDLDGLLGDEPEPEKPERKRRPAKTAKTKPDEAPASEPVPEPEAVEDSPPDKAPTDREPAVQAMTKPEPVAEAAGVVEEPAQQESEAEPEAPATPEVEVPSDLAAETEPLAEVAEDAPADPTPPRLFFLTNSMNLNGVLSSRVLAPRESFHKYYADLLELAPGWVPILTGPPPASLIDRVVAERGAGAPVLVELPESAVNGPSADGPVVYVRAALLSGIKAIHFREEKSLRKHRARRYSNVHPHEDLLQVSPELFASSDAEVTIAPPEEAPSTDWLHHDRVRGAVSAALAASDSGESLAVAAGLLGATELPPDTILPPWLTWAGLTGEARAPASETDAEMADRLIFQAAYRVLGGRDQAESWSPSEVLETVAADIAANLRDEAQRIVDRNLQRVRELLNIERDFEPFRNPGSPYVAAKSFLMVLLRPDLGELLDWPTDETGADETTRVVAAVLAGRLRGLARESVKLRSIALDDITAEWAVRAANGETSSIGAAQFVTDHAKTALLLDGAELHNTAPLIPDPVSLYEALSTDARQSARIAVSRHLGWPVQVRVHVPAGSDVQRGVSIITITSTESVKVETQVDEQAFLGHLRGARKSVKATAVGILLG